jgi:hypothetical protein
VKATPKQLELVEGKTREELLLATAPHIDPESPALKASLEKVAKIELAEAATAVLEAGTKAVEAKVRSTANTILASAGLPPKKEPEFDDFDWHDDPSVVLKSQPATAIYYNPKGCIVIRQEKSWADESDPFVYITPENAVTFMEALAKRARE